MPDDKRDLRILIALIVAALGIGAAIFGVVRGLSATGPGRGVRLQIAIAPPLDPSVVELATRVVKERCDEKGIDLRVVSGGDRVVAELGEDDPEIVGHLVELIERRAVLEVHQVDPAITWFAQVASAPLPSGILVEAGIVTAADDIPRHERGDHVLAAALPTPPPLSVLAYGRTASRRWRPYVLTPATTLAGSGITTAEVASGGVAIGLRAPVSVMPDAQVQLAFVLDGIVTAVATVDHAAATDLHVRTTGATEDDAIRAAIELVTVVQAGAVPALHVTEQTPFTRATGFFPRAWPFFAIGGVMVLAALFVARRRR